MEIIVSSQTLVRELELLIKVVAQKPSIPVLANILIQAESGGLRLAATDLEIGLITFCLATVTVPGTVTLPAKHLLDIVKLLPNRDITFLLNGSSIKLSAGTYNSRLPVHPMEEYPQLPSMKDLQTTKLPVQFQTMVNRVRFAVSDKDKRYFMDGGLLTNHSLAATDGHRLAYTTCEEIPLTEDAVIIPTKTLDKLAELFTADAICALGPRHLFFVMDGRLLFSRRIEGQFPKYERIIPRDTNRTLNVSRLMLQEAMQRVVLTSKEVVFKCSENLLTLIGRSSTLGDAVEQLDVQYTDVETSFILNGEFLLQFLNTSNGITTTLTWKDGSTLLFTSETDYAYVQMPMRST